MDDECEKTKTNLKDITDDEFVQFVKSKNYNVVNCTPVWSYDERKWFINYFISSVQQLIDLSKLEEIVSESVNDK